MYFLYSVLLTIGFIVLLPRFVFDALTKGKYAAGFRQRLGYIPKLEARGKKVVWLHCVSVGETNAARELARRIASEFPDCRLVVSTTTRTGQKLAKEVFADVASLVFYFPFDWRFAVRRAIGRIKPSVVLLMETELWFNFIREAARTKARIILVNGRLSERSYKRFGYIKRSMGRLLGKLDAALMQDKADAKRIMSLGLRASKVKVAGNMKFDHNVEAGETALTAELRTRFRISPDAPLIVAASTHAPEEKWVLDAFKEIWKASSDRLPRLLIAPRHPERFAEVEKLIAETGFTWTRRTRPAGADDHSAEVILLDTIGELRAVYPLAELVFVGGSLVPHGGQSIFEPAAAGRAIVTGPHTQNFDAAVKEFLDRDALVQMGPGPENETSKRIAETLGDVMLDHERRQSLAAHAIETMDNNRGAVERTLEYLEPYLGRRVRP